MYNDIVNMATESVSTYVVERRFFYPNFPQQVMEPEEAVLFVNTVLYYVFWIEIDGEKAELSLIQNVNLKGIDVGLEEDFEILIASLINSKTSISKSNKEIIRWAFVNIDDVKVYLPKDIKVKENLVFILGLLIELDKLNPEDIVCYLETPTDVLRYVVQLSGGDVSLIRNTKFKKFKRNERRFLLGVLENMEYFYLKEEMMKYKNRWIRLGEILHPTEYKEKFPKVADIFIFLRNSEVRKKKK